MERDADYEAIDFGYWLMDSLAKDKYSKAWVAKKYSQFVRERHEKTGIAWEQLALGV